LYGNILKFWEKPSYTCINLALKLWDILLW
jgi:hypothetical protein